MNDLARSSVAARSCSTKRVSPKDSPFQRPGRRTSPVAGSKITFTTRPLNVLTFGQRDTVVEAQVTDLGTETIRWAARPVVARKLEFRQGPTLFQAWVDPRGRMLRLEHVPSGLRVDRDPPAVKKRASPTPAPAPKPGG